MRIIRPTGLLKPARGTVERLIVEVHPRLCTGCFPPDVKSRCKLGGIDPHLHPHTPSARVVGRPKAHEHKSNLGPTSYSPYAQFGAGA